MQTQDTYSTRYSGVAVSEIAEFAPFIPFALWNYIIPKCIAHYFKLKYKAVNKIWKYDSLALMKYCECSFVLCARAQLTEKKGHWRHITCSLFSGLLCSFFFCVSFVYGLRNCCGPCVYSLWILFSFIFSIAVAEHLQIILSFRLTAFRQF